MSEPTNFNYEEASHAVEETKTALERAQACVDRLHQLLTENPASFAPLAEPAFRLRDRLIEDLGTLEAGLARTGPAADAGRKPFHPGEQARAAEARGVSQGDVQALGGQ